VKALELKVTQAKEECAHFKNLRAQYNVAHPEPVRPAPHGEWLDVFTSKIVGGLMTT
jgi:hypothetical protein